MADDDVIFQNCYSICQLQLNLASCWDIFTNIGVLYVLYIATCGNHECRIQTQINMQQF